MCSNQQQRLASKLLRGLSPAKRRRQRRRRRRLATPAIVATATATDARGAPSPHLLHDQARGRTVPDALGLLLRIEPPQQKLAVLLIVREAPAETNAKHDAAQHRARVAAARGHAPQTLDRLAHAVADLGAPRVLARYDGVQVDARRRAEDVRRQAPLRRQVVRYATASRWV